METQLTAQRNHVLREFSLDNKEGALARLVGELSANHGADDQVLGEKIDTVVREFSLDEENSALSRLVRNVDRAQRTISQRIFARQRKLGPVAVGRHPRLDQAGDRRPADARRRQFGLGPAAARAAVDPGDARQERTANFRRRSKSRWPRCRPGAKKPTKSHPARPGVRGRGLGLRRVTTASGAATWPSAPACTPG